MTRNCGRWKSASATCANWKNAASPLLASIEEQGKLTPALKAEIEDADTKQRLEDLPALQAKRRTKAQIAREAGIEPLALALLENPELTPDDEAEKYLNAEAGFADNRAVLDGAARS